MSKWLKTFTLGILAAIAIAAGPANVKPLDRDTLLRYYEFVIANGEYDRGHGINYYTVKTKVSDVHENRKFFCLSPPGFAGAYIVVDDFYFKADGVSNEVTHQIIYKDRNYDGRLDEILVDKLLYNEDGSIASMDRGEGDNFDLCQEQYNNLILELLQ